MKHVQAELNLHIYIYIGACAHAPLDAFLDLEQEALVVLVGDAHEALQERAPVARAEAEHVHHLPAAMAMAIAVAT